MTSTWQPQPASVQSDEARAHAARVSTDVAEAIHAKYTAGQREHGGKIWQKAGMLGHLTNELHDGEVYAHVLRDQLTDIRTAAMALVDALDSVLGEPED